MSRPRLVVLAALCVLGAFGVVACGPRSLPIDEWVAKADGVCGRAQAAADADPAPQSPLPGDKLRLAAQRSRSLVDELRELPPPEEKRSSVDQYLIVLDHRNEQLVLYADALDKTPANAPGPPVDELVATTGDAMTRAAALGFSTCAVGIDASLGAATTTTSALDPSASAPVPTAIGGQPENEENTEDQAG